MSGNPSGRPSGAAGIAARVREHTGDDYGKLVDGLAVIAFGNAAERQRFFGETVAVSVKDRLSALVELRDSAVGRPRQTLEHDVANDKAPSKLIILIQPPPPGHEPIEPREGFRRDQAVIAPTPRRHDSGRALAVVSDGARDPSGVPDFTLGGRH